MNVSKRGETPIGVLFTTAPNGDAVRLPLFHGDDAVEIIKAAQDVGTVHPDVRTIDVITTRFDPPVP